MIGIENEALVRLQRRLDATVQMLEQRFSRHGDRHRPAGFDPLYLGNRTLYQMTASGAAVTNTTTETTLLSTTGKGSVTVASTWLDVGVCLSVKAWGIYGTQAVPITLRIKVKFGSTVILDTGAQTPGGGLTNRLWYIDGDIVVRTTGSSGTVMAQGEFVHHTSATDWVSWEMLNTGTVTYNTTASAVVGLTGQWGAGVAAADTITCMNFCLEIKRI